MVQLLLSVVAILCISVLCDRSEHLERLSDYELIHINVDNPKEPLATIHFTAFGEQYSVELKRNDNLIPANVRHTNGNPQIEAGHPDYFNSQTTSCHYIGKVLNTDKPSVAMISMCDKRGIRGHVHIENETLRIYPSAYYMDTSKHHHLLEDEHIIYKLSDENVEKPLFKSVHNPDLDDFTQRVINDADNKRRRLQEQANDGINVVEVLILLEPAIGEYYQQTEGDNWYSELTFDMTEAINWVSGVYEDTVWERESGGDVIGQITITIVEFEYISAWSGTYTSLKPAFYTSNCDDNEDQYFLSRCIINPGDWLNKIDEWMPKYKDTSSFDNLVAITYKEMDTYDDGWVSGIAWLSTMCTGGRSASVNRLWPEYNDGNGLTAMQETIAHEIGHNFGASHDQNYQPRCNTNSGLMGYGYTSDTFSVCSIDDFNDYFESANMGCLEERSPALAVINTGDAPNAVNGRPTSAPSVTPDCVTMSDHRWGDYMNGDYEFNNQYYNNRKVYYSSDTGRYLYYYSDANWHIYTSMGSGWYNNRCPSRTIYDCDLNFFFGDLAEDARLYTCGGTPGDLSNPDTPAPVTPSPTDDTDAPTPAPTDEPTPNPTEYPTNIPTEDPTDAPTSAPTDEPTDEPTEVPTDTPTDNPTDQPTKPPTPLPTPNPTDKPTSAPTEQPTVVPTDAPTVQPTVVTLSPTTASPITSEPTTANPTTDAPTTGTPTTAAPTTSEPTTASPTTSEPTTSEPTTGEPTTSEPTTVEPTTDEPTTSEPTDYPTTAQPTTDSPTTFEPTTGLPTTAEPTPNPIELPLGCGCDVSCYDCLTLTLLATTVDGNNLNGDYTPIGQCIDGRAAYQSVDGNYYMYYDATYRFWFISTALDDADGIKAFGAGRRCRNDVRACSNRWYYLTNADGPTFSRDRSSPIDDGCALSDCDSCFYDDNVECLEISKYKEDVCVYNNNTVFDGYAGFEFVEACAHDKPIFYYSYDNNDTNESITYYLHYDKYYKYQTDESLSVRWIISESEISKPGIAVCEEEYLTNCTDNSWIVSEFAGDSYRSVIEEGMTFHNSDCYEAQGLGSNDDNDDKSVNAVVITCIVLAVCAVFVAVAIYFMCRSDKKRRDTITKSINSEKGLANISPAPSADFNSSEPEIVYEMTTQ